MSRHRRILPACSLALSMAIYFVAGIAQAAPPLEAYGDLPQVELMRVSPSGSRVAMIGVANDKRRLIVTDVTQNKVLKAAAVGENTVRDLSWAGDDQILVTISTTTPPMYDFGMERALLEGVLHVGLDGQQPWSVFEHSDDIEHTVFGNFGAYPQQGHWYGYYGGITRTRALGFSDSGYTRQHNYTDLYRVDLETSKPTLLASGAGRDHRWVVSADGNIVAHSESRDATGEWALYAGRDRGTVLLKKQTLTGEIGLMGLGRGPGTVLVLDQTGTSDILEEIDVTNGHTETLFEDVGISDYFFDPLTGFLIGAETTDDPWALFVDPALQKHYLSTRKAFPKQHVKLESFSASLKEMIIFTDGADDPGTFWLVSSITHRADPVAYPYAQIKSADVGPIRKITYAAVDGMALDGILSLPPGREAKNLPLVVLPHGGPLAVSDEVHFDWWAQAFASHGYAVFQPNFRGSGGHTVAYRKAGYGEWGKKMLSDIADGVAELGKQGLIDPKRASIVGASYGGYAALAGVTLQQGLYRCAVSVSGPANMANFMDWQAKRYGLDSEPLRYLQKLTGADHGAGSLLHDISPAQFAKRADAPIMLIHGKDDTRVPIEQSREMAAALKGAGKTVQYVELEKEDHFLSRGVTRIAMLNAAVGFVEKYNPAQ
jgi:dipeptidyl aminopeptidase/acylaminoacyl peptidase